jgi:hypothetical protein
MSVMGAARAIGLARDGEVQAEDAGRVPEIEDFVPDGQGPDERHQGADRARDRLIEAARSHAL